MSRTPIDALILIERAPRELDVACIMKIVAGQRHGLRFEVIQQNYGFHEAFRRFQPRVIVLPNCYDEYNACLYLARWPEAIYYNLTWEQLFYPGNIKAKTPRGRFATRYVIHHAWSHPYADLLRAQGVPEAHMDVGGHPALMLYRKPYRSFYATREELARTYGMDPRLRWVFFPENYNWAFFDEKTIAEFLVAGHPEAQVREMQAFARRSFESAMRWCADVARSEGVEIVIRPRPTTVAEDFRRSVEDVVGAIPPRLHVTKAETVREWILAADLVVSSYSTSLIEASVAGTPVAMVEPEPLPDSLRQSWHEFLPHLTSEESFGAACRGSGAGGTGDALCRWAEALLLPYGDAIHQIVDRIARLCREGDPQPEPRKWAEITPKGVYGMPRALTCVLMRTWVRLLVPRFLTVPDPPHAPDLAAVRSMGERYARWQAVLDRRVDAGIDRP